MFVWMYINSSTHLSKAIPLVEKLLAHICNIHSFICMFVFTNKETRMDTTTHRYEERFKR